MGKTDPPARVEAHRGTFVDSVQRLAIREEAFDAVRRRFGLFLAACLIVYPLGAALMLALANDPKIAGSREQFAYFGYLVLLMTPIGAFGGFLDARWNKKALATIDEILVAQSVGNDVLARLLINPAEAISHQCVHADRKDLMNGTFKQYLERRGSGIRRFTRSVWGRAVRGPERAHRLRVLIKRDLILRASRTAWQNRNK
ncbi:hypothetical protein [Brevibacterium oceani]|uniref:hypothetical protein n=1 Tax=Brevibacterium oceani TaxID=358099 RepID=UPI0015E67DA6|nr:hypothetical protein [Brevibacterium oceani]